ncbi:Inner membrane protein yedI [Providencia rustigianii]|nr:Inner membrane protein yedI [Providencia rustigianii]
MAGSSLLALLDDIAAVLDDVSVMTKMAAKKTSGVLGDDLALNAQQVTGVRADRELPVVWSVAKGSFLNKLILVPLALLISAFIPWAVTPLLMVGGAYLCFEGAEKLAHKFLHKNSQEPSETQQVELSPEDIAEFEKQKIKGAIRTDFVLSAEIIAITLGIVSSTTFLNQVVVLSLIAIVMTIGVYGLVAGIVKLDDLGFYLQKKSISALT